MKPSSTRIESDFLVLGSGMGGLLTALKLADAGRVEIVTKKDRAESNTNYAQGGIACVVGADDSYEAHVRDTLEVGDGLCHEDIVRMVVEEGPERIRDLVELGMHFDQAGGRLGEFDLGREGGHSRRRVLHAGDFTGREIEMALLDAVERHPRIRLHEHHVAMELIMTGRRDSENPGRCAGAYVYERESREILSFVAPRTVIATGGTGKVYLYTSNPDIATGDGIAMAYRAGARIANMEFIQFHPTCLYHPEAKSFLISEALRGEGGVLRNAAGEAFMEGYHPMGSLAPRDVVARAIDDQMKRRGDPCVYLDVTHLSADFLRNRFPNIYSRCLSFGIDMARQLIPVVPAAHYCCGGVVSDRDARTDVPGLWVVGETACTGLHGANRLASNSLLEALVMSHHAAESMRRADLPAIRPREVVDWDQGSVVESSEQVVLEHNWNEIRQFMWNYVGIVRTDRRLRRARRRLRIAMHEIEQYFREFRVNSDLIELRNIATVASLIIECAARRKESRGLHYTLDYPRKDDLHFRRDTVVEPITVRPLLLSGI